MKKSLRRLLLLFPTFALSIASLGMIIPSNASDVRNQEPKSRWWVNISRTSQGKVCLGQKISIVGQAGLNHGAPYIPADGIAVDIKARVGEISHDSFVLGEGGDYFAFSYTAKEVGDDQISATGFDEGIPYYAEPINIQVTKNCAYRYTLKAVLYTFNEAGEFSMSTYFKIKSSGVLIAQNADEPLKLASGCTISIAEYIYDYTAPGLTIFTMDPGYGNGTIDAKAEPDEKGENMVVELLNPYIPITIDMKGEAIIYGERYPVSYLTSFDLAQNNSGGAWVKSTFASDGGTNPVHIDFLDRAVEGFQSGGGTSSYNADLTLERIEAR